MKRFPTIKFSSLLSSVAEDLRKFDGEGLIDEIRLIKVVRRCNDLLGAHVYETKQCAIPIEDYQADLPLDFYKVNMAFAMGEFKSYTGLIATGNHYEWTTVQNTCMCEGGYSVCVTPLAQQQQVLTFNTFTPLNLSNNSLKYCSSISPNRNWSNGLYNIDIDGERIITDFEKGLIYLNYQADLVDEKTGELLVPFHARLNDYYENSIKVKIFEDLMTNSEAEVEKLLAYYKRERNMAYSEAIDFVMSKSYKEWSDYTYQREIKFFNKYHRMFH